MLGTASAALPVALALSGSEFRVSASRLEGAGFVRFARGEEAGEGAGPPVAISGIGSACLRDLCQSVVTDTPVGPVTVRALAGSEAPATASDLVIDLAQMAGDVTFTRFRLARDPAAEGQPAGMAGRPEDHGQRADTIVIENLRQIALATTAGVIRLPGLRISVDRGRHECS
ncbi:hypothetical protein LX15_005177 [Streptoalloteichus tenebrarius]|uniref:Cholesterol esterase n=1 Tax=Streptoalloteichus tenebrarius (strain ATCC 17920 / DSM 40477 / JCM 4838 / CBS 697.72 / NBRC 16177 / NCIMB 11028 / NRRL B-12390 / A12253. 1 / ISP 5477) TaxID=1933 RepID=A0ABT1I141_STRSD|nr:DUF6230 family protein [Streptoalloteichus tenebrarius]MCP2261451.1 hypothetical protein [Streptoalloteichus tenebrarius]BFE99687.1 hypothetical protein GCM10020241_13630 [Streptoalloteichus tenebrarius]